jgi:hypothetical protein
MRWLLALILIGFSGYFLYTWHQRVSGAHPVIAHKAAREDLADDHAEGRPAQPQESGRVYAPEVDAGRAVDARDPQDPRRHR